MCYALCPALWSLIYDKKLEYYGIPSNEDDEVVKLELQSLLESGFNGN